MREVLNHNMGDIVDSKNFHNFGNILFSFQQMIKGDL